MTKINSLAAMKYILKGAPITLRYIGEPWASLPTPGFPLFISILSGVCYVAPGAIIMAKDDPVVDWVADVARGVAIASCVIFVLNLVSYLWYALCIKINYFIRHYEGKHKYSARRVLYYGTAYQLIEILLLAFPLSFPLGLPLQGNGIFEELLNILAYGVFPVIAILLRLIGVFMAMYRETSGVVVSLCAPLVCLDAWIIFLAVIRHFPFDLPLATAASSSSLMRTILTGIFDVSSSIPAIGGLCGSLNSSQVGGPGTSGGGFCVV